MVFEVFFAASLLAAAASAALDARDFVRGVRFDRERRRREDLAVERDKRLAQLRFRIDELSAKARAGIATSSDLEELDRLSFVEQQELSEDLHLRLPGE